MSPRAACRLRTLGFESVHDYVAGKVDWLAHGLPTEGEKADVLRVKDAMRDDVVVARLDDRVGLIRERVESSPYGFALVTSEGGVLLGRLRRAALEVDPECTAEDALEAGPSTVHAHVPLDELIARLREGNLSFAVATTPEGKLLGVVRRADAEAKAQS